MSEYTAPLRDMQFALHELADLEGIGKLPGYEEATPELVQTVLEEAAKFAQRVLSPLNRSGDLQGARWHDGAVSTSPGWKGAYDEFVANGWNTLSCPAGIGGQNLPRMVSALVEEMWNGANVAFGLCPMLTRGAIEAIELRGSEALRRAYLPKMVTGEWTGTMNLTEPQAGSDLAAVRTRAVPQADGSYTVSGQKIFITYGEHDLTENIIHLVLARRPDAPEGVKGISLFVVPKFLPDSAGKPGTRNEVRCVSIEHKLGIHGSPTAVLAFNDATGYLVGEENRGLEYMFIMMNAARYAVGLEGIGISERAYQRALAYARDRVQGTEAGARGGGRVPILRHPDVRRMLMMMKSQTEAMRALAAVVGAAMDRGRVDPDERSRTEAQAFAELMIPVVKGWSTENSVGIASLGVQIHGGMGFIEETGAAQHLRDARITPIYEGTTAIQANDLVGRKLVRDGGATAARMIAQMREAAASLTACEGSENLQRNFGLGVDALETAVKYVVDTYPKSIQAVLAGSVPLLTLFGIVGGGWQMVRAAHIAHRSSNDAFYAAKLATARFYGDHLLTQAPGIAETVVHGAASLLALADDQF
jgi:alkylation response protein AidB-like acyl-CoA dehydrogenase